MFWDKVAGVYDIFVRIINKKTHKMLIKKTVSLFTDQDEVLECACGTGMLSAPVAGVCRHLTATDFSENMLKRAKKNCREGDNISFTQADIMNLPFEDNSFDKVVAANVIHLLDEPMKALCELRRVCRNGGQLIIPTYINRTKGGKTSGFAKTVGKAGADFKRQFTFDSYKDFFADAGFQKADYTFIDGKIPCALAVITIVKEV
ncbi:MAG: class I SAM-dependent methyltransferase [Clostridia bacterium]|nr:class I SAM-dependent methyltransferase [Clostridia bacterium]